ncbi:MAG: hypothetical protein JW827_09640 [Spirochaetes bacterium]|nr:hypothetical protein [Spirochaetota bacterium]
MKKSFLFVWIISVIIFIFIQCMRDPFQPVPEYTGSAQDRPAPPWIDDFNHLDQSHNLIKNPDPCPKGTFDGPSATNRPSGYAVHDTGALKIGVTENTNGRWFGFYCTFDSTVSNNLGLDCSAYNAITFKIKGSMDGSPSGGGLRVGVRAVGTAVAAESNQLITKYLPGGVSADWQTIVAPFTDFDDATGWSTTLAVFVITFKDASGQPSNGTIWIDDLKFLP